MPEFILYLRIYIRSAILLSVLLSAPLFAADKTEVVAELLDLPVGEHELSVARYPADGEHLIIWIAPGYGTHERAMATSGALVSRGVEVWHVDLADSLFLPKSTSTMRNLDGSNVLALIEAAHQLTGKNITLLTRSYGALPLLKGARLWQKKHAEDNVDYLSGAILFSPEMYSTVPSLGLDPEYEPIASATSIPIVLYQAGKRSNRWQLDTILEKLQQGGATVFYKIKSGVIGIFYSGDKSPETMKMFYALPDELMKDLGLLKRIKTPKVVNELTAGADSDMDGHGLDTELKYFKGDPIPKTLNLITATGERFKREDYEGKVTVVNFWATWCPPCVEEIPSLNNLREAMLGKPFELISVNYAEKRKVVTDFLEMVNVDFPVLLDEDGKVSASWNVLVYPSTFIIGPDGSIKYGVNGAIHWDHPKVKKILSEMMKGVE